MLARRIHVYTHQIHATLYGLIQTLFQGVLLYVMLVLADTDTLRVDLDQLGQRSISRRPMLTAPRTVTSYSGNSSLAILDAE